MHEIVGAAVKRHVTLSLEELREPAKAARWLDGERAREEAAEIVLSIIADAERRLTEEETGNES